MQLLHIAVQSCGDRLQSIDFDAAPAVFVVLDQSLCDADAAREFGLCHARGFAHFTQPMGDFAFNRPFHE